jgi:hypothetical protein
MPDYSKSKIYTIRFNNSNEIYIGSTTQSLSQRIASHKKDKNCSLYQLINTTYNSDWNNCYIELYENCACNNKEELLKKEGELIRLFKNDENYITINKAIPLRTKKEWCKDNENKIKEWIKDNENKLNEYQKVYRLNNKDKSKDYHKEYRLNNKDKIKEEKKEYYINNKLANFINFINSIFII